MTLMTSVEYKIERARQRGWNDRELYEGMIQSMREVKNVENGNISYVQQLIQHIDENIEGLRKDYSEKMFQEYYQEKNRLTGMLKDKTVELEECTLN